MLHLPRYIWVFCMCRRMCNFALIACAIHVSVCETIYIQADEMNSCAAKGIERSPRQRPSACATAQVQPRDALWHMRVFLKLFAYRLKCFFSCVLWIIYDFLGR